MQDPEGELLARLREAQEAVRARDDFLAIAAHELRSPLNALSLRLAALERMAAAPGMEKLRGEIVRTRRSVERYVRRAVVLLDVSRLNAGALQPVRSRVRARELVDAVVEAHADEAAFHGTTLHAQVDADVEGHWDAHMVEQIVTNLVTNAIKYGNGSPVQVRCAAAAPGWAAFEVEDRGPGLSDAQRARLFQKFERVVPDARSRAGFGLGLWITGRMVAAHGGSVTVERPAAGGTLFRVLLPTGEAATQGEGNK